jgi:hypothetical protein
MKADDLRKVIRSVIQEELRNQLPLLIPQVLTEILNNKNSQLVTKPVNTSYKPIIQSKPVQREVKKEFKKYTSNPLLNQILNETTNKLVPENSFTGFGERPVMSSTPFNITEQDTNDSIDYSMLNESVIPSTPSKPVVADITPVNEDQAKVLGKLNRDFRGLMKAIDEKKKNGTAGFGGSVSME